VQVEVNRHAAVFVDHKNLLVVVDTY